MDLQAHIPFMEKALQQAKIAYQVDEVPVGAVIVYQNTIIATAHNQVQTLHDPTAHAEIIALRLASKKLESKYLCQSTLYVTLEPCPMCAHATYAAQLGQLIFATKDPKRGYSLWPKPLLHPKTQIIQNILPQQSKQLLQNFFQQLRKKKKQHKYNLVSLPI